MAAQTPADGSVHRLVDMEVQEVSLVDRAANKRRFLVVKRSEGMGDKRGSDSGAAGTAGDVTGTGPGGDAADTGDASAVDGSGSLVIACDALEGLTRAVEQLQGAGTDTGSVIGDVVQELRAAADLLQEQLGAAPGTDDQADSPASGDAVTAGRLETLLTAVGELVMEIRASRSAAKADDEEDDSTAEKPSGSKTKGEATKSTSSEPADSGADLKAIHTELKNISGSLQQHTRRLDRLEKRSGVPTSQPAGERPAHSAPVAATDDVSWPLDLNSPRSR